MLTRRLFATVALAGFTALAGLGGSASMALAQSKELVYLTPGLDLAFWRYLSKGIENVAKEGGYNYQALDSGNNAQTQLQNAKDAIARGVSGIIISPTDSSTGAPADSDAIYRP